MTRQSTSSCVSFERPAGVSIVFEDCAHVPQFEHPEKTHELVREFFHAARLDERVNA